MKKKNKGIKEEQYRKIFLKCLDVDFEVEKMFELANKCDVDITVFNSWLLNYITKFASCTEQEIYYIKINEKELDRLRNHKKISIAFITKLSCLTTYEEQFEFFKMFTINQLYNYFADAKLYFSKKELEPYRQIYEAYKSEKYKEDKDNKEKFIEKKNALLLNKSINLVEAFINGYNNEKYKNVNDFCEQRNIEVDVFEKAVKLIKGTDLYIEFNEINKKITKDRKNNILEVGENILNAYYDHTLRFDILDFYLILYKTNMTLKEFKDAVLECFKAHDKKIIFNYLNAIENNSFEYHKTEDEMITDILFNRILLLNGTLRKPSIEEVNKTLMFLINYNIPKSEANIIKVLKGIVDESIFSRLNEHEIEIVDIFKLELVN